MALKPIKTKSNRGGKRPGAGRPKGAKDTATREMGGTIADLARAHTSIAVSALVQVATGSDSDAAKVSAANAILDRGYGKPPVAVQVTGEIEVTEIRRTIVDPK